MKLLVAGLAFVAALSGCVTDEPLTQTDDGPAVIYVPPENTSQRETPVPPPPPPPVNEPTPPPSTSVEVRPPPRRELHIFPGEVTIGAGASAQGVSPRASHGNGTSGTFEVGDGASVIVAELVWVGTATDLDLFLLGSDYRTSDPAGLSGSGHSFSNVAGDPAEPDNPAKLVVEDLAGLVGEWRFEVGQKSALSTEFTLYVSVFYHGAPTDTYSALGA